MTRVVVRHDRPIADALRARRPDLTVIDTESVEEAVDALGDADAFAINAGRWREEYLEPMKSGTWVQATSTGYATFPLEAFEEQGIKLTNAHGNYGPPVADHTMALTLALARGVHLSRDSQLEREWNRRIGDNLIDLEGLTMTIVGLGDIGESIAIRAAAFGMNVYGIKRDPSAYDGVLDHDRVLSPPDLQDMLPETDVLVLIVPLTDDTRNLVDAAVLAALPDSAFLINVARGPVVDTDALIDALDAGDIAGAALDVFDEEPLPADSPLWDRRDVLITPHIGGRSKSFVDRYVTLFLKNLDRLNAGEPLINRIV